MQDVLEQLKAGIRRFQTGVYPEQAEMYQRAASEPQEPHTFFIACADSRIEPETITQTKAGELFVLRNIGNIIPAYGEMMGGVSAVVEYAVSALKVKHVVVCGHTECGAMAALMQPDLMDEMPAVRNWMTNAAAALGLVDRGTLEAGKRADFVIWDVGHPAELSYWIGGVLARRIIAGGAEI